MTTRNVVWLVVLTMLGLASVAGAQPNQSVCCDRTTGACTPRGPGGCPPGLSTVAGGCASCQVFVQSGACCVPSGSLLACVSVLLSQCSAQGGTWMGAGSVCGPQTCDYGACCVPDDDPNSNQVFCFARFRSSCNLVGSFIGNGTVCTPTYCQPAFAGACCQPFGSCTVLTEAVCVQSGLPFVGVGTTCTPTACSAFVGACCDPNGCTVMLQQTCASVSTSVFVGLGTICGPQLCAGIFGACCDGNGGCTLLSDAQCGSARLFLGAGTTCGPNNPCGAGRCCLTSGACVNRFRINCNAPDLFLLGSLCEPLNTCPQPTGACCDGAGACTLTTADACDAGRVFLGLSTVCGPSNPCGAGRCCLASTGACVLRFRADCSEPDLFTLNNLCNPVANTCPQPSGACCDLSNGVCSITGPLECPSPNVYYGNGSTCLPYPCPPANDDCAGAVVLTGTPFFVFGTTRNATTTGQVTLDCDQFGTSDVFYTFVPPVTGEYSLSLCQTQVVWDSSISVHSACPPSPTNILACGVDCDPAPSFFDLTHIPSISLQAGTAYTIRVASAGPFATSFGEFRLDGSLLFGACCVPPGLCLELSSGQCSQWGGTFIANTVCSALPCPPVCPADIDLNGAANIDDIFVYLDLWFAGCNGQQGNPCNGRNADLDNSGSVSIDDIFVFLNLWFAGCP